MPIITIEGEVPTGLSNFAQYQCYNNFDAAITAQLLPVMKAELDNTTTGIYQHEMRLQRLCLEMSTKGFPIDVMQLAELLHDLERRERRALWILHRCCEAVGYPPLNPNSTTKVPDFFYNHLGLPEQTTYDKSTRQQKVTTDIKALEKLRTLYPISTIFVNCILAAREAHKMGSVFRRGLEPDYRLRCNFNPVGTDTGRMSSQKNPFNRGTNAQNLTNEVRKVIALDPDGDYIILNPDLKTAESIAVGYCASRAALSLGKPLEQHSTYREACLSSDLHTQVARMNWKHLPWTGDLARDKKIAEQPYYRMFSYRDMAKRGGHGTNYYGTPRTMGMHLKLPTKILEEFQNNYFTAFPEIQLWHLWVISEIQTTSSLTTQFGRKRRFWGRSGDAETHRSAIAFEPQSIVADVMDTGLCQLQEWLTNDSGLRVGTGTSGDWGDVSIIAQVHDSGPMVIRKSLVHELVPKITSLLNVPIDFPGIGTMVIPVDFTIGHRWYKSKSDPLALQDYTPDMKL